MISGLLVGLALLLGLSLGNPASAGPFWDYVDVVVPTQHVATGDDPLEGTFNIMTPGTDCYLWACDAGGFDPITQDVGEAAIAFVFFDSDATQFDVALIDLGEDLFVVDGSDQIFNGYFFDVYLELIQDEVGVLLQLSEDGWIDWTIQPAAGNPGIWLEVASLGANAASGGQPPAGATPEPTAALLFCVGFGVVGAATRKRRMH
jgi:hypothetical protein